MSKNRRNLTIQCLCYIQHLRFDKKKRFLLVNARCKYYFCKTWCNKKHSRKDHHEGSTQQYKYK